MLITEQTFAVIPLETLHCDASPMPPQQLPTKPVSRVALPARRDIALASRVVSRDRCRSKSQSKAAVFSSPFKDGLEGFGELAGPRYCRPVHGKVNSYIKFNWPQDRSPQSKRSVVDITNNATNKVPLFQNGAETYHRRSSDASDASSPALVTLSPTAQTSEATPSSMSSLRSVIVSPHHDADPRLTVSPNKSFSSSYLPSPAMHWPTPAHFRSGVTEAPRPAPRPVPPHFGHTVAMDSIDRKLWGFCKSNSTVLHSPWR